MGGDPNRIEHNGVHWTKDAAGAIVWWNSKEWVRWDSNPSSQHPQPPPALFTATTPTPDPAPVPSLADGTEKKSGAKKWIVVGVAAFILLGVCGSLLGEDSSTTTTATDSTDEAEVDDEVEVNQEDAEDEVAVDWENHDPSVKRRIDRNADAKNCSRLQEEFDTAEANSDIQRARVGDGNSDLMGYIDQKMSEAGCYG